MATPSTTNAEATTSTTSTTTKLYEYIASYDFSSDLEFRKGLGAILGHPETPASDKNNNSAASHATQQPATEDGNQQQQQETQTLPPSSESKPSGKDAEPTYPSSFAHIVELITTGQPIPGIEDIPDTVLSGHEKPSKVERRRKPWEKAEEESRS